jgi:prophage regulatory protein
MSNCTRRIHTPGFPHPPGPHAALRTPPDTLNVRSEAIRMLRLAQVLDITGLGKTKIYELQAAGHFPMRVQITMHSVGWVEAEVQAWLANRVATRLALRTTGFPPTTTPTHR